MTEDNVRRTLMMPPDLWDRLRKAGTQYDMSTSAIARYIIWEWLEKEGVPEKRGLLSRLRKGKGE